MNKLKQYYLIHIQFLGFRYHGWQRQSQVKTVQEMVETTILKLDFIKNFKVLGGSRTDSMVSANHYIFMLYVKDEEKKLNNEFLNLLNKFFPPDILAIKIEETTREFNIIQSPKLKEYRYYFSFGDFRPHPFSAPLLTHIRGQLDIDLMKKGALLFQGTHCFKKYCYQPSSIKNANEFFKTIEYSEIDINLDYVANFFPEKTYCYKVIGNSFSRHQVRLMVGTLFKLGLHEISIEEVRDSLKEGEDSSLLGFIAPASGLVLHQVTIN